MSCEQEIKLAVKAERERLIRVLNDWGLPRPDTDSKAVPCEHDFYLWHTCESCAVDLLVRFIESGDAEPTGW
jgi:hypothetical protein